MTEDRTLAKRKAHELRELIEGADFRAQLAKALPNAMSPERFVRIVVTSTMRNPKLLLTSRDTFFRCLLDLSAMGLEPDGRQAHLIPRKNKTGGIDCTVIIDYKGLKELLHRNGDIIDEHSDVVGELDIFEYEFGTNKHLRHVPNTRSRGKIFAAYSFITLTKGGTMFEVMSVDEIELVRKRSANPDGEPWIKDWAEMAKKTVFKRLAKSLPLSPKTRDAIEVDNTYEMERESAAPVTKTAVVGGRRELPPEDEAEQENQSADPGLEQEALEPAGEPDSPPEPVSAAPAQAKPPGPLTRLKKALKESGFLPGELLALLKSVRLVNPAVKDLNYVPAKAMEEALSDWDNCLTRLRQERERAGKALPSAQAAESQEEFPQ